eukprot:TRINITY_DN10804_c0_g1_i1.p1 TRINITY_DN10804_c0_g1~~TRINITY_DN10804_c0_g1_i1.p1  ORF type:complete len:592 (+),score=292.38 TRINITY_DN10804_c0_g1_i1:70-1845(+)
MPLSVDYEWEETSTKVLVRVFLKRVNKAKIDVFFSDCFVKVNCSPYLWEMDLRHHVDVERCRYGVEEDGTVRIAMFKQTEKLVWHMLRYQERDAPQRREESKQRAMEQYNANLTLREAQKAKEDKRFFSEHWELEKQLRAEIEEKVERERAEVSADLDAFQDTIKKDDDKIKGAPVHTDPASISAAQPSQPVAKAAADAEDNAIFEDAAAAEVAPVRSLETTTVSIDFTPSSAIHMPQRSRSDEEVYRRSRYKPKSLQDTPFFFKEKADKQCAKKDWKGASDSYSEALKRDTCFLAALQNRSLCWLMMHNYKRAVEDSTLALNLLQNTPAANTTGDRFRHGMMKIFARRSAAYSWDGQYEEGLKDLEMAIGYCAGEDEDEKAHLLADLETLKTKMKSLGMMTEWQMSEAALKKCEADKLMTQKKYEDACEKYTEVLEEEPKYMDCFANRVVALLCLKRFKEAIADCDVIIAHCQNVASALADGGVGELSQIMADSDDEDEDPENPDDPKKKASAVIKSSTTHVYALLKAFIRKGSAMAGLQDYRGAWEHYELALRIMPYDDDLRKDMEAFKEKLQMHNLVKGATGKKEDLQ